ncbi:bifunctional diguanylate cyclase/phosphodiesterase [Rhodococcus sp. IEGM 1401]|uniref:putative bifunctional diguanylate cyclase/phosphodiesterase n=1 Tax=unclassified Rhodococcus (in: high G+C Gram-positive bacteria) TaxID=192944 RepID=UPI0022B3326B|nr:MULTISPECIES: bifunctional diguanylate cyclase/phosphodiesterase [unclassified Rhodococcus (in: high G+C Gram-positive bacteria)]MCZ4562798.1 bifunctional diguanylate cyclase/phosphodiesterase [Rhodococcus sp. IEGM 1401]MDI9922921.1 bifunctional diguanylate cyclase/phosphodiesterase [Rhodococcus sp. IEGM 1372]MDV8035487.1 bifunctional diguanylate cyclase/phosphodiesterase [Rhodococcus sp. IEGM 1414]
MLWTRFLGLGVLAVAAYAIAPAGIPQSALYAIVLLATVAAFVYRYRREPGPDKRTWKYMAVGVGSWGIGDALVSMAQVGGGRVPTFSSSDVFYLIGYLVIAIGFARAADENGLVFGIEELLECLVVAVGFGLATWVFVISDGSSWSFSSALELWPATIYLTVDAFLLTLVGSLYLLTRATTVPFLAATAGVVLLVAADFASYAAVGSHELYRSTLLNTLWLAAYVCFGVIALHIPERTVSRVDRSSPFRFGRVRFLGLSVAVAVTPFVMAVQLARGIPVDQWGWVIVASSALVIALVGCRMACFLTTLRLQAAVLEDVARTDAVTGLASRRLLRERLDTMLATRGESEVFTLVVDIDRFAQINETFGYSVGDSVLREIGHRLVASVRSDDLVGRLGGDQFVVAMRRRPAQIDVSDTAERLQFAVSRTMFVHDINVALDAVVGIASTEEPDVSRSGIENPEANPVDGEAMLQRAHVALTAAKAGHTRVGRYEPDMDRDRHDQMRLLGELDTAIRDHQLRVFFQPCLDLESGSVDRVEALLRWQHPREGLIGPSMFLPDAERTGMLPAITALVLDEALAQCSELRRRGVDLSVSVNLSVRNLLDETLTEQVAAALAKYAVPAHALEFEVTETTAMTDPVRSVNALTSLRGLGVTIAIDDYGTGYSSLAYLQSLPVQTLKIDRSFVSKMNTDDTDASIVRSTIDLARSLGVRVMAEGVEDAGTLDALRELGCDGAQGYFLGRPMPAEFLADAVAKLDSEMPTKLEWKLARQHI